MPTSRIQIAHVAGMNDVEAAIGEDNFLTLGTGILDGDQQLCFGHHTTAQASFLVHRTAQFRRRHHSGAQFADHDTGGNIGQRHRIFHGSTGRQRHRQHGNHRIAGAGHIKYFPGPGRQV